ncbi:hypothetical protein OIE67_03470 [Nonomuraea fuscirosea]|nr:hypothetical protein [Nonomuraea fuscirosea]WSA53710.1 hypothetical protein OIE67_03470 [Nonomuraea fuscirosea]
MPASSVAARMVRTAATAEEYPSSIPDHLRTERTDPREAMS